MTSQLDQWLDEHAGVGLPAFAQTVRDVASVAQSAASSAQDLSSVISNDAAMTARLLQIANSSMFNPQGRKIDTVSAAVVMLGFHAVRDLAVSVSVIDEFKDSCHQELVGSVMATAFHAATHAKALAQAGHNAPVEEVFVAALLKEVGAMAFWSKDGDRAAALAQAIHAGEPPCAAEKRVLGFTLDDLSARLSKDWNLGDLIGRLHQPSRRDEPAVVCVTSGHEIAHAIESGQSDAITTALGAVAGRFDVSEAWLDSVIEENAEIARSIAKRFGVSISPNPPPPATPAVVETEVVVEATGSMQFLDEIAQGLEDGRTRDDLMTLLVDGTAASIGARFCFFLLLSPDRSRLVAKYVFGERPVTGAETTIDSSPTLEAALAERRTQAHDGQVAEPFHGGGRSLSSGVHIAAKPVGVFYAEFAGDVGAPSEEQTKRFRQAAQQIALILTQAA